LQLPFSFSVPFLNETWNHTILHILFKTYLTPKPFNFGTKPTKWSHWFSSADDSKQDNHDGDYQKNVNETAHGVRSY